MNERLYAVMTTVETTDQARALAAELVRRRLAACVSIGAPVESVFPWEGRIDIEAEIPLTIKTAPERLDALKQAFSELHPYDVPELLALGVVEGLDAYIDWAHDWMNNDD